MSPREVWRLDTERIGRQVFIYDEVGSTNTLAGQLAEGGAENGTAVLANHQSAGRGQHGRVWQSRPGSSLLLSIVLYPPVELRRPAVLTACAAVAVGQAILQLTGLQARMKWPNDLLIGGKKVCGILIEQGVGGVGNAGTRTVIGLGLNLNQTAEEFDRAGLPEAASLQLLTGQSIDVRSAAAAVLRCFDALYVRLLAGELGAAVEAEWKWRAGLLGQQVVVERTDGTRLQGQLREMSFDGLELEGEGLIPWTIPPEAVALILMPVSSD